MAFTLRATRSVSHMRCDTTGGAALITVLVIVFIVMAIIANLTVVNYRMIRRLENRQLTEQAAAIAYSAIDFGRAGLGTSAATATVDTLKDIWAQPLPRTQLMGEIYMSGYVVDEQSKFNLNDLVTTSGQVNTTVLNQFTQLLSYINLPPSLAFNLAYYMASPQYQSEIMLQYTTGKPAYRPAGRPLVDLAEVLLVKGMNPEILHKMSQYVTVIPQAGFAYRSESAAQQESQPQAGAGQNFTPGMAINANTAPAEVIAAKSGIQLPIAQRMISYRASKVFGSNQDITSFLAQNGINPETSGQKDSPLNLGGLGVSSNYFTIHAIVDDEQDQFRWVALVYRPNRSGQWPQILWQHPE